MKTTIAVLLFLLFSSQVMGQIDYLEPIRDYSKYKDELNGYYSNVFSLLNTGVSKKPYARYAAIPSFSPEYALSVETKGGKYYLISNTLSQNCWQAEPNKIKVNTKSVIISRALYLSLGELARLTTSQIQDMDGSSSGLDGITYYLTSTNEKGKVVTGKKWSPNRNTLMGRMVQIYESAYALTTTKGISESLLLKESQLLIKDLRDRSKTFPNEYKQPQYAGAFAVGIWKSIEPGKDIETVPQFPNNTPEEYASSHLAYPTTLQAKAIKGYALCEFTVSREGRITNPHILKSSHPEFADEAMRIVKGMPQITPATSEGSPVACNYILYIPFRPSSNRR